jgi:Uncharacterised nucleotidyltransferase
MWDRVDTLLERAPHVDALRLHRVELLEARRRRAAGLELGPELRADEAQAVVHELAVRALLARVRAAWDGPLVLFKGPELALDYPSPHLRRFGDLDVLTDDAQAAQAALLAAGFEEVGDPDLYLDIHHLRPLWWPGLPLIVELHMRPKWPAGMSAPPVAELLAAAVPSRLGVGGVSALPAVHHTLVLAAHAWEHQPLGRLGNLIDVAVTLQRCDEGEVVALARRWGCARMWRTTQAAIRATFDGGRRSAAVALWARHLEGVRERTVFEWHVHEVLAPLWGMPVLRAPRRVSEEIVANLAPDGHEPLWAKLRRAGLAITNARVAQSEHDVALEARGLLGGRPETGTKPG